jgi:hypothetical protein
LVKQIHVTVLLQLIMNTTRMWFVKSIKWRWITVSFFFLTGKWKKHRTGHPQWSCTDLYHSRQYRPNEGTAWSLRRINGKSSIILLCSCMYFSSEMVWIVSTYLCCAQSSGLAQQTPILRQTRYEVDFKFSICRHYLRKLSSTLGVQLLLSLPWVNYVSSRGPWYKNLQMCTIAGAKLPTNKVWLPVPPFLRQVVRLANSSSIFSSLSVFDT